MNYNGNWNYSFIIQKEISFFILSFILVEQRQKMCWVDSFTLEMRWFCQAFMGEIHQREREEAEEEEEESELFVVMFKNLINTWIRMTEQQVSMTLFY